jgi:hypothetical protein
MTRRLALIFLLALAVVLPVPTAVTAAAAPVVASWKAALGTDGDNGSATLVTNAAGTGTFRLVARGLTARAGYPVDVRVGSCAGTRIAILGTTVASSTGRITRSFGLTTTQAAAMVRYGSTLYARVGSSTRMRCGPLVALPPTGTTSGMTMRVPAGAYSGGPHLFAVEAFEPWTPDPAAPLQPGAGDVLVTALARIDARAPMPVGPALFHARDSAGVLHDVVDGRERPLRAGVLAAGEVEWAWLTFQVPAAEATGLTLVYAPASDVTVTVRLTSLAPPVSDPTATLPAGTSTLGAVLAGLPVAAERRAGYSRSLFRHWIDADKDGCDTRREVLIAEAVIAPTVSAGCSLSGGRWLSLYDDLTVTDPGGLDIDHLVPLAEAWDSGAYGWDAARRQAYANDLGVAWSLIAVSASSNRSKGDADPAEWLPPDASYTCQYVADWVAVKARWSLSVDSAVKAVIASEIACLDMPVRVVPAGAPTPTPTNGPTPTNAPTPTPTPTPGGGSCDPNYAGYCVPIVSYDLDCSDIRHRVRVVGIDIHHFDSDGDGIGCESYPWAS